MTRPAFRLFLAIGFLLFHLQSINAVIPGAFQDTVTGAFEGTVTDGLTGAPIPAALVEIINSQTGNLITKRTDPRGRFYQGLLSPGIYRIRISIAGYQPREVLQRLNISRTGEVVPVPVSLDPVSAVAAAPPIASADAGVRATINATDARQSASFSEEGVTKLPLGATALSRTFDELALISGNVALPPETLGAAAGPGVGSGVGSAGQFSAGGLRSRGNNFTVDGSDNNDEDIGVRRQGFVALTPQPIESIKEYQIITLLAPAQFGRNLGAQVNAVSKSGGNETHGALYGLFNSSQLNARNYFDATDGNAPSPLRTRAGQPVLLDGSPIIVRDGSGGKDSFTLGKIGAVLGGPIKRERLFYFLSAEGQIINATQEASFAVPTVEQRGVFGGGATGLFRDPFTGAPIQAAPANRNGSAIFSLIPFPNRPQGIYGENTFTQTLPASGRGLVLSAKLDQNFKTAGRQQTFTGRFNYTNDRRIIPVTGEALFSSLEPRVRTQNLSLFLNSELTKPNAVSPIFNQLRFSYGRTRLAFREARNQDFLIPSVNLPNVPFLLNAREILNQTSPAAPGQANTGPVNFISEPNNPTVEEEIGSIGQVLIAGFSPIGVDVFNFPQRRVNNTWQLADNLSWRKGDHNWTFGVDLRRTELNSALPRNSRSLISFAGGPLLSFLDGRPVLPETNSQTPVLRPEDFVSLGAANGSYLTLARGSADGNINLRFNQYNVYAQDDWKIGRNFTLAYGLRYEYNTPPKESRRLIENSFRDPSLQLVPGLNQVIDGRREIFEADRNNFAPRVSAAYSRSWLGRDRVTVLRGGFGLFYDQILGSVVTQSRNVYPNFLTLNLGGLFAAGGQYDLALINPAAAFLRLENGDLVPLTVPGTSNLIDPRIPLGQLLGVVTTRFLSELGVTLPTRKLNTPMARQYSVSAEQQLSANFTVSIAYIGTTGDQLLRFTTPNLGLASTIAPSSLQVASDNTATAIGRYLRPARPLAGVGVLNQFETTAESRYDAFQFQARGRFSMTLDFQATYTYSHAIDNASDVFDLAGSPALPQNSLTFSGERGSANFDARHRFAYSVVQDFSGFAAGGRARRRLLNGLQLAGTGQYQTGQPFTVGSIFDVNLDGNLTDRLNTTTGLIETGDRNRPVRLGVADPRTLLAPFGTDGAVGRNTFRAGGYLSIDLAILKDIIFKNQQRISFRLDAFNLFNRANFGVPARFLEAPGFGFAPRTLSPNRRIQIGLKYVF